MIKFIIISLLAIAPVVSASPSEPECYIHSDFDYRFKSAQADILLLLGDLISHDIQEKEVELSDSIAGIVVYLDDIYRNKGCVASKENRTEFLGIMALINDLQEELTNRGWSQNDELQKVIQENKVKKSFSNSANKKYLDELIIRQSIINLTIDIDDFSEYRLNSLEFWLPYIKRQIKLLYLLDKAEIDKLNSQLLGEISQFILSLYSLLNSEVITSSQKEDITALLKYFKRKHDSQELVTWVFNEEIIAIFENLEN